MPANVTNPKSKKGKRVAFQTEERLNYFIQNGEDLIKILDERGIYEYTSPSIQSILGYEEDDLIGKSVFEFIHPDDLQEIKKRFVALLAGDEVKVSYFRFRHADGSWRWLDTIATNLLNNADIRGIITNSRDITEKVEKEAEHELIITELTKSNNDLKQFTFIVSHNLRSPLSNIQGLLSLIDFDTLNESNSEILRLIEASAQQLTQTINDIGNILILKNKVNISLTYINIESVLNKVNTIFLYAQNELCATLTTDFQVKEIYYNQLYLESIFTNLISNALKYRSPERALIIDISTYTNDQESTVLKISDNGLGVDLIRFKDRIFGMYQRFHEDTEGVGLGLFIIKSQIEAIRGEIAIESEIDKGTTFFITFTHFQHHFTNH